MGEKRINCFSFHLYPSMSIRKLAVFMFVMAGIIWLTGMLFDRSSEPINKFMKRQPNRDEALLILAWNNKAWIKWEKFLDGCSPDLKCAITTDRSRYEKSSAVIFHIPESDMSTLPMVRDAQTYFVYFTLEAPTNTPRVPLKYRGSFNLTMTFRMDSDVVFPYGEFIPSEQRRSNAEFDRKEMERLVEGKSRLIAWFVSNCKTANRRKNVVRRMMHQVPVDIFGACGTKHCPRKPHGDEKSGFVDASDCHRLLTETYKFYLSFENSICRDYVTEKFFSILDNALIVPVVLNRRIVLGTARDLETARALNRSFIALDDFPSTEALAEYLKYLDANTTAYLEFFDWRVNYEINFDRRKPGCELCRLLMRGDRKILKDPDAYYLGENSENFMCSKISSAYT